MSHLLRRQTRLMPVGAWATRLGTPLLVLLLVSTLALVLGVGCKRTSPGSTNGDGGSELCGNGVINPGEICDDGNNADGDDCRADCGQDLTLCGNGTLDAGENCDDGNILPEDGCSPTCRREGCDALACPSGCCTSDGTCAPGNADDACGSGGASCTDCTTASDVCIAQSCQGALTCTPGDPPRICGNCGTQDCQLDGTWTACTGEGVCATGATQGCGDCGTSTCTDSCTWGSCAGEGCSPGATQGCGDCGTRTCNSSCDWGSCNGEGCSPGATQGCGDCGTSTCNSNCNWGSCTGEGCHPGSVQFCGTCGNGTRTCTGSCTWGSCSGSTSCTDAWGGTVCPGNSGFRTCVSDPSCVQDCTCSASGSWTSCQPGCLC